MQKIKEINTKNIAVKRYRRYTEIHKLRKVKT